MKDSIAEKWLNGISQTSQRLYRRYWNRFLEYTQKTSEQLLKLENGDLKAYLLGFRAWLHKQGMSEHSSKTASGVVRGFFSFYEKTIKLTRGEKDRLRKTTRKTKDYRYTKEDLRKMALVSDLREKYIVIVGKSLGMRAGDFIKLTYGDYRSIDLDQPAPISLGEVNTQKEGITANPFLDSDSLPIVKQVLESNKHKDRDRIITVNASEVSVILTRVTERANIQHGLKRVRFHCLRKFLIDRLSSHMSESQWKQVIGKLIDEKAYVSTDMLRQNYARAMKDITVMNENNLKAKALRQLEQENVQLKEQIEGLQTRINELQQTMTESQFKLDEVYKHYIKTTKKEKVSFT